MSKRSLDFTTDRPQKYYDSWRNRERTCLYSGQCINCMVRTYGFTDGENDPRGILGERAKSSPDPMSDAPELYDEAERLGVTLEDVPACFLCMNEEGSYKSICRIARGEWERQIEAAEALAVAQSEESADDHNAR